MFLRPLLRQGTKIKKKRGKKPLLRLFRIGFCPTLRGQAPLWQLLPLGGWGSCNTWVSLVVLPETIPHMSGCIMISSFGRWLLQSLSPRSGMSCTFNFSSGQNRRSLPPLHPETPVRGGMRDVIASIPLARGTTFARSAIELIELYLAPPLELHLILPRSLVGLGSSSWAGASTSLQPYPSYLTLRHTCRVFHSLTHIIG